NFGTTAAFDFDVISDTSIVATAPALAAGTVDITVVTYSGTSATGSADHFTANAAAHPVISSLSTTSGGSGRGTAVTITGSGVTRASDVEFGTTPAVDFTVYSDTLMTAVAPPSSPGVWDITVTTPANTSAAVAADRFTFTAAPAPAVTGLSVTSGSA